MMKTNKIPQGMRSPKRMHDLSLLCGLIGVMMIVQFPSPINSFTFPSQRMRLIRFGYKHHTADRATDAPWRYKQNLVCQKFSSSRDLMDNDFDEYKEENGEESSDDDDKGDTQAQIQRQQEQIDFLMKMIQKQTGMKKTSGDTKGTRKPTGNKIKEDEKDLLPKPLQGMFDEEDNNKGSVGTTESLQNNSFLPDPVPTLAPITPTATVGQLPPLKTMLFIDGTWFYYSIYRRKPSECPICRKYGSGWEYSYRFDWNALPRVICEQLVEQQENRGWSSSGSTDLNSGKRPMEIVRAPVFTSYLTTTAPNSSRALMFKEMADANYDMHMLDSFTQGKEKCVDISLAVDMVHFATVPNAYDVALLLSGDKDFIPAMVRTRQKGKKVGLVSMRRGCNQALYDTPHVKDFDVVWIDDLLDELMVPLKNVDKNVQRVRQRGPLSSFTFTEVILDFISKSPNGKVSSRDMGRYLKRLKLPDSTSLLDDIKLGEGGLLRFCTKMSSIFKISHIAVSEKSKAYWISKCGSERNFFSSIDQTTLSPLEQEFLQAYRSGVFLEENSFRYTCEADEAQTGRRSNTNIMTEHMRGERQEWKKDSKTKDKDDDFSSWTVVKLKERCKERSLPVSGTKAVLIERILSDVEKQKIESPAKGESNGYVDPSVAKHIEDLVKYFLLENGGVTNLKSLVRFLASNNASSPSAENSLEEVNQHFGDISNFLSNVKKDVFRTFLNEGRGDFAEVVMLKEGYKERFDAPDISTYLENIMKEYIKASGGVASSRNLGRYLQANSALKSPGLNALQQLKAKYATLLSYLRSKPDRFTIKDPTIQQLETGDHSFGVQHVDL